MRGRVYLVGKHPARSQIVGRRELFEARKGIALPRLAGARRNFYKSPRASMKWSFGSRDDNAARRPLASPRRRPGDAKVEDGIVAEKHRAIAVVTRRHWRPSDDLIIFFGDPQEVVLSRV